MSSRFLGRAVPYSRYGVLSTQKLLLEQHFPFLHCGIIDNTLVAIGWLELPDCRHRYKIRVEYRAGREPKSTVLSPVVPPSPKIHMYGDHSLCLHYWPDMRWTERTAVYLHTIPWIAEWIVYYEIFELNGGHWEGPESPFHLRECDKHIIVE